MLEETKGFRPSPLRRHRVPLCILPRIMSTDIHGVIESDLDVGSCTIDDGCTLMTFGL